MGSRNVAAAMLLLLLVISSGADARTIATVPLPGEGQDAAATLLLLQLVEQAARRSTTSISIVRGRAADLEACRPFTVGAEVATGSADAAGGSAGQGGGGADAAGGGGADAGPARGGADAVGGSAGQVGGSTEAAGVLVGRTGCLRRVASRLKADLLLAGAVTGSPGEFRLDLLRQEEQGPPVADSLLLRTSRDGLAVVLRFMVQRFFTRGALRLALKADLLVRADPPHSEIFVQGVAMGRGQVLVTEIPVGEAEVMGRAPHHLDRQLHLPLAAGEVAESLLLLEPGFQWMPAPGQLTWIGLGSTAALLLAGVVLGRLEGATQHEFDGTPLRPDTLDDLHRLKDRGEGYALAANTSFIMAGTALIGSGTLYYLLDWRKEMRAVAALRAAREQASGRDEAPAGATSKGPGSAGAAEDEAGSKTVAEQDHGAAASAAEPPRAVPARAPAAKESGR